MADATNIPASLYNMGPIKGGVPVTMVAEEALGSNAILAAGTADRSVKLCGTSDVPIGVTSHAIASGVRNEVQLFGPVLTAVLASASDAVVSGDTLQVAAAGEVSKGVVGSGLASVGICLTAGSGGSMVQFVKIESDIDLNT